jgi:type I restriction enzyme, S subunit
MTVQAQTMPRALAVWFKDLHRWDYGFFRTLTWAWSADRLFPVGTVLERKQVEVSASETKDKATLPIIEKISFGGQVSVTDTKSRENYKGRLFWAASGNLIYSKIRVKQGSLAVVPDELDRLAVSAEYPVYDIKKELVNPVFLTLVLKSRSFLSLFEGLSHGGSTKTRIPPAEFERQLIPLPNLAEQTAIVSHWRKAQDDIAAARGRVEKRKAEIDGRFFADLGLRSPIQGNMPKAFAVLWQDFLRWGVSFNYLYQSGADLTQGNYPVVDLGSFLERVQYGTSEKANTSNDGVAVIRMNNILDGELDLGNLKHIRLSKREMDALLLRDDDILFNRTNSKELVGKCAVFHAHEEYVFASYLIRIRVDLSKADPDFIAYVVNSPIGRQQINALSRQIIGQANINSVELRGLQIPLPPLSVQKQMMKRVAAGREEIAREREAADLIAREINAEIEALILGTKKVREL